MSNGFRNFLIAISFVTGTVMVVLNTIYVQDKFLDASIKSLDQGSYPFLFIRARYTPYNEEKLVDFKEVFYD